MPMVEAASAGLRAHKGAAYRPDRRAGASEPRAGVRQAARGFGIVHGADGTLELPDHLKEIIDSRDYQGLDIDIPIAVIDSVAQTACRAPGDLKVGVLRFDEDLAGVGRHAG